VLTKEIEVLSREEFGAAQAAAQLEDSQAGATGAMSDADSAAAEAAGSFEDIAAAEAEAARQADNLEQAQERLQGRLEELQLRISTDITPQFGDFKGKLEDLNAEIAALETEQLEVVASLKVEGLEETEQAKERLTELNEQRKDAVQRLQELQTELEIARLREGELNEETSEASRLQAEARLDRLTADIADQRQEISSLSQEIKEAGGATEEIAASQQAKLAELEAEYAEKMESIRGEIDDTTEAWSQQTKEIIFNLATQRLGIGGFTEEEIRALTTLAGPEGLGLLDEAGVALIEKVDLLSDAMSRSGDQSGLFAEDMVALSEIMADPTRSAEELAAAIRDIGSAVLESFPTPRFAQDPFARQFGAGEQTSAADVGIFGGRRQFGGPVGRGRPVRVGERGEELFIPRSSGEIVSNRLLSVLNSLASALPIAAPPLAMAAAGEGSTTTNNSMTINTSAPVEPIAADFNLLALMGERRG